MQETERLSAMPELPRQGRPGAHARGAAERAGHDDQDRTSALHQPPKIALFWVSTIFDDIPLDRYRLDHVCVYWYVDNLATPHNVVPYESVITGYPPNLRGVLDGHRTEDEWSYARDAVDELFTADEAIELQRHLMSKGWASTITPATFPFHRNTGGAAAFNMGGRYEGMINLSEEEGYALSVPVSGSYDLQSRGVVWRENPTWEPRPLDDIPF